MKQIACAALGVMLSGSALAQELKVGGPMPDPVKRGGHFLDNPIELNRDLDCLIQKNRYTDADGKRITYISAFPSMDWAERDKPYIVWDVDGKKFYLDNRHADGKKGPDGIIDEIITGQIDIIKVHPYCKEADASKNK